MWCYFFLIMSLILCLKLPTEARSGFWGILAHFLRKNLLKASTLRWATDETFVFNIDHTDKFVGFKSGDAGGYISLLQNLRKWCLHQFWVFIEEWDRAPSCWKVKSWFLKCFFISSKCGTKILLIYRSILILTHVQRKSEVIPRFGDCSPHHEETRPLSAVDCSRKFLNDC